MSKKASQAKSQPIVHVHVTLFIYIVQCTSFYNMFTFDTAFKEKRLQGTFLLNLKFILIFVKVAT